MFLAVDTSAGTSVAVVDHSGETVAHHSVADTMRHAEVVGSLIRDCLDDAKLLPDEVSAVVVGMGPGPFTGLRVGIAAGRAFAQALGVPVLPVVSHDAIAAEVCEIGGARPVLVVTDARRKELYWSVYSGLVENGVPLRLHGPGLSKPDSLPTVEAERIDARTVSAGFLGRVAALRKQGGMPQDRDEPLYLRSPDVTASVPRKRP